MEVGVCHIKEESVFNLQTLASGVVTLPLGLYPLSDEGLLTLGGGSQPKFKSHPSSPELCDREVTPSSAFVS